jgi:hypothetical protein
MGRSAHGFARGLITGLFLFSLQNHQLLAQGAPGQVQVISFDATGAAAVVAAGSDRGVKVGDRGRIFQWVTVGATRTSMLLADFTVTRAQAGSSECRLSLRKKLRDISLVDSYATFERELLPGQVTRICLLSVTTEPPGAEVTLDGKKTSPTPVCINKVTPGKHEVEVRKPGFFPASRTFFIKPNTREVVSFELKAIPEKAQLRVLAGPPGASVFVDGEGLGVVQGLEPKVVLVDPGEHEVRVEHPDCATSRRSVRVNGDTELSIDLQHLPHVEIDSDPGGARVYLNGVASGTTPYKGVLEQQGPVEVRLELAPFQQDAFRLIATAGEVTRVERVLRLSRAEVARKQAELRQRSLYGLVGGGVVAAAGVTCLALSFVEKGNADSAYSRYLAVGGGSPGSEYDSRYSGVNAAVSRSRIYASVGYSALVIGAAGLGYGIWQQVKAAGMARHAEEEVAPGRPGAGVMLFPRVWPGGVGLGVGLELH